VGKVTESTHECEANEAKTATCLNAKVWEGAGGGALLYFHIQEDISHKNSKKNYL